MERYVQIDIASIGRSILRAAQEPLVQSLALVRRRGAVDQFPNQFQEFPFVVAGGNFVSHQGPSCASVRRMQRNRASRTRLSPLYTLLGVRPRSSATALTVASG